MKFEGFAGFSKIVVLPGGALMLPVAVASDAED